MKVLKAHFPDSCGFQNYGSQKIGLPNSKFNNQSMLSDCFRIYCTFLNKNFSIESYFFNNHQTEFTRFSQFIAGNNLALLKPATQSSTWSGWGADRAVDGNYNTNGYAGSCTNTNDAPGGPNWLMVDLQRVYTVGYVVVVNRADGGNGEYRRYTHVLA